MTESLCSIQDVLVQAEEATYSSRVVDLSHDSAVLQLNSGADLGLAQLVELRLDGSPLVEPLTIPARVRSRTEQDDGPEFSFQYLDWLGLIEQLPPALRQSFSQRDSERNAFAETIAVELHTEKTPGAIQCTLRDLSSGGLSVYAKQESERILREVTDLQVTLQLPDGSTPVRGCIRHRELGAEGLWYGIAFDRDATPNYFRILKRIELFLDKKSNSK